MLWHPLTQPRHRQRDKYRQQAHHNSRRYERPRHQKRIRDGSIRLDRISCNISKDRCMNQSPLKVSSSRGGRRETSNTFSRVWLPLEGLLNPTIIRNRKVFLASARCYCVLRGRHHRVHPGRHILCELSIQLLLFRNVFLNLVS